MSWALAEEQDRRDLTIDWVERNGSVISPPTRKGFGSQLLERMLNRQIGARAMISYEMEGLRAHVVVFATVSEVYSLTSG